jgi:hypothetical protein
VAEDACEERAEQDRRDPVLRGDRPMSDEREPADDSAEGSGEDDAEDAERIGLAVELANLLLDDAGIQYEISHVTSIGSAREDLERQLGCRSYGWKAPMYTST